MALPLLLLPTLDPRCSARPLLPLLTSSKPGPPGAVVEGGASRAAGWADRSQERPLWWQAGWGQRADAGLLAPSGFPTAKFPNLKNTHPGPFPGVLPNLPLHPLDLKHKEPLGHHKEWPGVEKRPVLELLSLESKPHLCFPLAAGSGQHLHALPWGPRVEAGFPHQQLRIWRCVTRGCHSSPGWAPGPLPPLERLAASEEAGDSRGPTIPASEMTLVPTPCAWLPAQWALSQRCGFYFESMWHLMKWLSDSLQCV